jgi:hypothetical protein
MKRFMVVVAAALGLLAPSAVHAEIIFQYVTDQSVYAANPGQPVHVKVFLQETDTLGTTLFGNPNVKGLESFGIYVHQLGTTGGSTITSFAPAGLFTNFGSNAQFYPVPGSNGSGGTATSSSSASMPPNSLDYANAVNVNTTTSNPATLVSGSPGNGVYEIEVGVLSINVHGSPTTFSLTSMFNSPGDNNSAGSDVTFTLPAGAQSYSLDRTQVATGAAGLETYSGAATFTETFTVISPEPSTLLLFGIGLAGTAVAAVYRRRKALAERAAIA